MVLTSAMLRVCPGAPEGIALCGADGVAVLAVNQGLGKENSRKHTRTTTPMLIRVSVVKRLLGRY
jgi:hypothetical protein